MDHKLQGMKPIQHRQALSFAPEARLELSYFALSLIVDGLNHLEDQPGWGVVESMILDDLQGLLNQLEARYEN